MNEPNVCPGCRAEDTLRSEPFGVFFVVDANAFRTDRTTSVDHSVRVKVYICEKCNHVSLYRL